MVQNLETKETQAHHIPTNYRTSVMGAVAEIRRRFDHERSTMADTCRKDGLSFGGHVSRARGAIQGQRVDREQRVRKLEEAVARRRALYDRASASLQTIYEQLQGFNG